MIDNTARVDDYVCANQYLNYVVPSGTTGRIVDIQRNADGEIVDVGVSFDVQPSEYLHRLGGLISQPTGYWCWARQLDFLDGKVSKLGFVSTEDLEELFV